jgi:hypothetical protein
VANAISYANESGGYLVEVNDEAENKNLFENVLERFAFAPSPNITKWGQYPSYSKAYDEKYSSTEASDGGYGAFVYIGATDSAIEGDWRWMNSNAKVDHSGRRAEWGEGLKGQEPNNGGSIPSQNYLGLALTNWPLGYKDGEGFGNAGSWNDLRGTKKLYFVVEKPLSSKTSETRKSVSDAISSFDEITKPSKFKSKFVDKLTNFNPSKDTLSIDSDSFGVGNSATFEAGKNNKSVKKLANKDFDFLYDQKKGGLYFNENGADIGFGDGGIIAILNGAPDLTSDNLEFL